MVDSLSGDGQLCFVGFKWFAMSLNFLTVRSTR